MRFVEVCGPPGCGKSTLVDERWPPRAIRGDGGPYPEEWAEFVACVDRSLIKVSGHPTAGRCKAMIRRAFRKMSAVHRAKSDDIYIQTGFAQRGLGIGWRLDDPEDVAEYFELMPVSLGVAFLVADTEVVQRRNVERGKDRSYMVPLMEAPLEIAKRVLRRRGVPVAEISTMGPVAESKRTLDEFVKRVS